MVITRKQAREDLTRITSEFGTAGGGTDVDRAAQLVMQTVGVLQRRLDKPDAIRLLYIDNPVAKETLPLSVYHVAQDYASGRIDESTARKRLDAILGEYGEVFGEMGISPEQSVALFGKQ